MGNNGRSLEEARGPDAFRPIDNLGRENEVARCDLFAEGTNCGEGEDRLYTERFESGDVRSGRDIAWGDCMAFSVASEESDLRPGWQRADGYRRAREAPRGLRVHCLDKSEIIEVIESAASDDANEDAVRR